VNSLPAGSKEASNSGDGHPSTHISRGPVRKSSPKIRQRFDPESQLDQQRIFAFNSVLLVLVRLTVPLSEYLRSVRKTPWSYANLLETSMCGPPQSTPSPDQPSIAASGTNIHLVRARTSNHAHLDELGLQPPPMSLAPYNNVVVWINTAPISLSKPL